MPISGRPPDREEKLPAGETPAVKLSRLTTLEQRLAKALAEQEFVSSPSWPGFVARLREMQQEYAMHLVRNSPTDYLFHGKVQGVVEFIDVLVTLRETCEREVGMLTHALQKKGA